MANALLVSYFTWKLFAFTARSYGAVKMLRLLICLVRNTLCMLFCFLSSTRWRSVSDSKLSAAHRIETFDDPKMILSQFFVLRFLSGKEINSLILYPGNFTAV